MRATLCFFTTAPILKHPGAHGPFKIEFDGGNRPFLSPVLLFPPPVIAFFFNSRTCRRNYDISNGLINWSCKNG